MVQDGGNININNNTGYQILLKGLETTQGEGKLVIYDTAYMHYYAGCGQPVEFNMSVLMEQCR